MKEKRITRMLAVLLAFMMVFTLIPGTALASGENSNLTSAYWPNFRGNDCNMAVVDAQTPETIAATMGEILKAGNRAEILMLPQE